MKDEGSLKLTLKLIYIATSIVKSFGQVKDPLKQNFYSKSYDRVWQECFEINYLCSILLYIQLRFLWWKQVGWCVYEILDPNQACQSPNCIQLFPSGSIRI